MIRLSVIHADATSPRKSPTGRTGANPNSLVEPSAVKRGIHPANAQLFASPDDKIQDPQIKVVRMAKVTVSLRGLILSRLADSTC